MMNVQEAKKKFPIVMASEAMNWPAPEYWDEDQLFLRAPGGSVSMIYAEYSNLKTTFAVCRAIAMAKETNARVLYIAAEGVGFLGPLTLKGAFTDWNIAHPEDQITPEWLDNHFRLITKPPSILSKEDELLALKKVFADWEPNLIFLDTLGASAGGQNLSAIEVGTGIGLRLREFSQASKIAAYTSDVFFIHHLGKNTAAGATGSRYFYNDVDQALELDYDQDHELLNVKVTKARGGEKDRAVPFGVRKVPLGGVGSTIAVFALAKDDPRRLAVPKPAKARKADKDADLVVAVLRELGEPGAVVSQDRLLKALAKRGENAENWRKNTLRGLVWEEWTKKGKKGGRPGRIFGLLLLDGEVEDRPTKPSQPYQFVVPPTDEEAEGRFAGLV